MMSINPIYNINYAQTPAYKSKEENPSEPVSNPVPSQNLTFKGIEALVAYNRATINQNNLVSELAQDKELTPCDKYNIPQNANKIKGEKEYYSSGRIKSNTVIENGIKTIYNFDSDENLSQIIFENKTVNINKFGWQHIIEKFGDNCEKETYHENRDGIIETHVGLTKKNLRKCVSYSNGIIKSCKKTINGVGFYAEFNPDGSLKNYEKIKP